MPSRADGTPEILAQSDAHVGADSAAPKPDRDQTPIASASDRVVSAAAGEVFRGRFEFVAR